MRMEHRGREPRVHETAFVAPTAVVCGDVSIGPGARVLAGAVVTAEGGGVEVGEDCIVMEHAVLRGVKRAPLVLGDHSLVGPHAHLVGCHVEPSVFIATGACVFNGARIGTRSVVRIQGIVHIRSQLPEDTIVPIGWVAIGAPAQLYPPEQHDAISAEMAQLDFARTVFGLEGKGPSRSNMPAITRRYSNALGKHAEDRLLDQD